MHAQRGVALVLVLIILGVGSLALAPTLQYAAGALKLVGISKTTATVQYAVGAITQQALAMLQYDTSFKDCENNGASPIPTPISPPDGVNESFANCVAMWGKWTLATQGKLTPTAFNQTQVEKVNGRELTVSVEVPGALTAPPPPTPTPYPTGSTKCEYVSVTRDKTWVQVGQPITYTLNAWNCSALGVPAFALRRIVALLAPGFTFVLNSSGGYFPAGLAPNNPQESLCDGIANDPQQTATRPDYFPCPDTSPPIVNNSKHLEWPSATTNLWSGSNAIDSGPPGTVRTFTFSATPTTWGVFYIDASICFFSNAAPDPGPCTSGNLYRSGKVAPVVVGMFNINGNGKGYAFGASSKLDNSGSGLISQTPQ